MNMKKLFFLSVVVLSLLFVASCSKLDEVSNKNRASNDAFEAALLINHEHRLNSILYKNKTRAEDDGLADEDLEQIAVEIDSSMVAFYEENENEIAPYVPEWNISDDELEAMIMDKDSLFSFVKNNMTMNLLNATISYFEEESMPSLSSIIENNDLNPFEAVVISNLIINSQFEDMVCSDYDEPDDPVFDENENKISECKDALRDDKQACSDSFKSDMWWDAFNGAVGLGGLGTYVGPEGALAGLVAGAAAGVLHSYHTYQNCVVNANRAYNRCVKNK